MNLRSIHLVIIIFCAFLSLSLSHLFRFNKLSSPIISTAQLRKSPNSSLLSNIIKFRAGAQVRRTNQIVAASGTNAPPISDHNFDSEDEELEFDDSSDNVEVSKPNWFGSWTALDGVKNVWNKTPPMTQVYVTSTILVTALSALLNSNKFPSLLLFDWSSILGKLQVWRLYTAFLNFGALDIFYPLTLQFVWQYMSQLEKLNYNRPEEFLVLTTFGASMLILIYTLFGFNTHFLGHNFSTYLVYIWSRVFEGTDVDVMGLITLKSEMIPWFFCLQSLVLEREVPVPDLIGIAVGHLYYYLRQKKALQAPEFLKTLFSAKSIRDRYARFRSDFE